MRNIIIVIALLSSMALQAQTPIVSLRTEKGGGDTIFLIDSNKRVLPDGRIVVEELWVPIVGVDSLKSYLRTIENVYTNAELEIDRQKITRAAAKKELKRIQKEIEEQGSGSGSRTVLKQPIIVASPGTAPDALAPGEYLWDGEKLIPKPEVKKTPAKKKKQ